MRFMEEEKTPAITCPRCHWTSHHPRDIAEGYCGKCAWWTSHEHLSEYRDLEELGQELAALFDELKPGRQHQHPQHDPGE